MGAETHPDYIDRLDGVEDDVDDDEDCVMEHARELYWIVAEVDGQANDGRGVECLCLRDDYYVQIHCFK